MKKRSFFSGGILSGKGFYIALGVSLLAIGGAAFVGVNSAINQLEEQKPQINNQQNQTIEEDPWVLDNQTVDIPKTDIPAPIEEADVPMEKPEIPVLEKYVMPVSGDIIGEFSGDQVVKSITLDEWVMHTGVDIKAAISTPVKSINAGTVTAINNDDMWGTTITISHPDGLISHYANLKTAVNVKVGQNVKASDVIGAVGETAEIERAEPSHLHFGIKKNDSWVDPLSIIR